MPGLGGFGIKRRRERPCRLFNAMLEIDYDLIPLPASEREKVAARALSLARRGKVPPLGTEDFGRIVVVNPNEGFTLNHVPDDLRRPLRRANLPVYEGKSPLSGPQLGQLIAEGAGETLYEIVVELHSDFPTLLSFLAELRAIRQANPKCRVMVHGDLTRISEMMKGILSETGRSCELTFEHMEGAVPIHGPQDMAAIREKLPSYPTLPDPFFTHLRLLHADKAELLSLEDLKKLYGEYGVGNIEEMDVSGKLRGKLITVDLPMSGLKALRFNPQLGTAFRGIRIDGLKVPAAQFAEKGLFSREVPVGKIEAVFRQMPGKQEEEIPLNRVRALRVNCFNGHVSFLWKPNPSFIPLFEAKGMRIHWGPPPGEGDGDGVGATRSLIIDRLVVTQPGQPKFGEVRAGIRQNFLQHFYVRSLERQAKLNLYAENLRIGSLGPLTAQTLRLLRRKGLGRLIPEKSLYYLCDSFDQIQDYHKFGDSLRGRYEAVLKEIQELFPTERATTPSAELVTHRLTIIREWARGDAPTFDALAPDQLDAVYKELKIFATYCESEFRRVEHGGETDQLFFAKLRHAQELGLRVTQLANLIGRRYGQLANRETFPDFVFFATSADTKENRKGFFLPGLALGDLFKSPEIQKSFQDVGFEFSVFLEEQLTLMDYLKSQEAEETSDAAFYDRYFVEKFREAERELAEWRLYTNLPENKASPEYEQALGQLAHQHQTEKETFRREIAEEAQKLEAQESRYFDALGKVNQFLDDDGLSGGALLTGNDYMRALDTQLVKKSNDVLKNLESAVKASTRASNNLLTEKKDNLTAYLSAFHHMQQTQFRRLQSEHGQMLGSQFTAAVPGVVDRLNQIRTMAAPEIAALEEIQIKRAGVNQAETDGLARKMKGIVEQNQKNMATIREGIRNITATLSSPLKPSGGEDPVTGLITALDNRLAYADREVKNIVRAASDSQQSVESLRPLYRRKGELEVARYRTRNEEALLDQLKGQTRFQRLVGKKSVEPLISLPEFPNGKDTHELESQYKHDFTAWNALGEKLAAPANRDRSLEEAHRKLNSYDSFQKVYGSFRRAVKDKMVSQKALAAITRRLEQMERETGQMTDFIESRLLPGHIRLCEEIYIPNTQRRLEFLYRARAFFTELAAISFDNLQRVFLDRAVYRRFHGAQFASGGFFGINPDLPLFNQLSNLMNSLARFHHGLRMNLKKAGYEAGAVTLTKLATERPKGILEFLEDQCRKGPSSRLNYVILPGTLSLTQALEIIHHKDALYNGIPQQVLIFVSKFDAGQIRDDPELREQYFRAVRHNVIINIDGVRLVDNPKNIAEALIRETVGCAHDLKDVEFHGEATFEAPPGTL